MTEQHTATSEQESAEEMSTPNEGAMMHPPQGQMMQSPQGQMMEAPHAQMMGGGHLYIQTNEIRNCLTGSLPD